MGQLNFCQMVSLGIPLQEEIDCLINSIKPPSGHGWYVDKDGIVGDIYCPTQFIEYLIRQRNQTFGPIREHLSCPARRSVVPSVCEKLPPIDW